MKALTVLFFLVFMASSVAFAQSSTSSTTTVDSAQETDVPEGDGASSTLTSGTGAAPTGTGAAGNRTNGISPRPTGAPGNTTSTGARSPSYTTDTTASGPSKSAGDQAVHASAVSALLLTAVAAGMFAF